MPRTGTSPTPSDPSSSSGNPKLASRSSRPAMRGVAGVPAATTSSSAKSSAASHNGSSEGNVRAARSQSQSVATDNFPSSSSSSSSKTPSLAGNRTVQRKTSGSSTSSGRAGQVGGKGGAALGRHSSSRGDAASLKTTCTGGASTASIASGVVGKRPSSSIFNVRPGSGATTPTGTGLPNPQYRYSLGPAPVRFPSRRSSRLMDEEQQESQAEPESGPATREKASRTADARSDLEGAKPPTKLGARTSDEMPTTPTKSDAAVGAFAPAISPPQELARPPLPSRPNSKVFTSFPFPHPSTPGKMGTKQQYAALRSGDVDDTQWDEESSGGGYFFSWRRLVTLPRRWIGGVSAEEQRNERDEDEADAILSTQARLHHAAAAANYGSISQGQGHPSSSRLAPHTSVSSIFATTPDAIHSRGHLPGLVSQSQNHGRDSSSCSDSTDPSDPYGYRRLAGPALLPAHAAYVADRARERRRARSRARFACMARYTLLSILAVCLIILIGGGVLEEKLGGWKWGASGGPHDHKGGDEGGGTGAPDLGIPPDPDATGEDIVARLLWTR